MADEASCEQHERIFDLAAKFAEMRGHTITDVILALFHSDTLRRHGYNGSGCFTSGQTEVCIGILESWIKKAGG